MALVVKSVESAPQSAIETLFRVPISVFSHFHLLVIRPKKSEIFVNYFITSITGFLLLTKTLYCQHKLYIGMYG